LAWGTQQSPTSATGASFNTDCIAAIAPPRTRRSRAPLPG
jgi:hypothetical protein